jgi:hypothetical protein
MLTSCSYKIRHFIIGIKTDYNSTQLPALLNGLVNACSTYQALNLCGYSGYLQTCEALDLISEIWVHFDGLVDYELLHLVFT